MSVGVGGRIRTLPFRGTSDPSLPASIWVVDVDTTGDGSGGANQADVIFHEAGEEDDSFYSLEQFGDQHDVVTALIRLFIVNNQRNYGAIASPVTSTIMGEGLTGLLARTAWQGRDKTWLPYFVGTGPAASTGLQLFLRFAVTNTNGVAYRVHAWGYRWTARAMDTPTGPRRPMGSVFG